MNYLHDSNSIFRAAGINSEEVFGRTVSSLYGSLAGRRAGEYYFSVDQEPCSSVSSGRRGRVLLAHMRKGFTRVSQHGVVSAGYSLGFLLFDCPLLILAGIALLGLALLLAFLSGAVLVW